MIKFAVLLGLIVSFSAYSSVCENERQGYEMGTSIQGDLSFHSIGRVSGNILNSKDLAAELVRTVPTADLIKLVRILNVTDIHTSERFLETERIAIDILMFLQRVSESKVVLRNCIAANKPSCESVFNEVSEVQDVGGENIGNYLRKSLDAVGGIYREAHLLKLSFETGRGIDLEDIKKSVSAAEKVLAETQTQRDQARANSEAIARKQETLLKCLELTNTDQ